jgi:hypothetical protein
MPYYPELKNPKSLASALKLIARKLREDPNFLSGPECPYPLELVECLQDTLVVKQINIVEEAIDLNVTIDTELEATTLFHEMKVFKKDLAKSDVNERAAMFRTMTSLMDKILNIKERSSTLKSFAAFEQIMLDTIDSYLEPKERTDLFDRLKKLGGTE